MHRSRPGYRRLELSVAQCGHGGIPEVLLRFQAVLLGVGTITGPERDDMYFWKAWTFTEAQAVLALLWRGLGPVKRAQAKTAIARVAEQYRSGGVPSRPPRYRQQGHVVHAKAGSSESTQRELDFAWAAGFLDGEGHFGLPRSRARVGAPDWHRIRASATQNGLPGHPPYVLRKMKRLLGSKIEVHGEIDDFRWLVEGIRKVRSVFLRVRPWLGTVKQEQALAAIQGFTTQKRLHGDARRCARGHRYTRVYISANGPRQKCNACDRIRSRMGRARRGIKPRQFKNVARRYTF